MPDSKWFSYKGRDGKSFVFCTYFQKALRHSAHYYRSVIYWTEERGYSTKKFPSLILTLKTCILFEMVKLCYSWSHRQLALNFFFFSPLNIWLPGTVTAFSWWGAKIFTGKQCCGSGSGIRCLFDPWIRDSFSQDPGSDQSAIFLRALGQFLG
jgi:hypothetical protein